MTERYFAKVANVIDKYTVVINVGLNKDVTVGKPFLIVGLGEAIIDPDTQESLGELEIIRGRAKVTHVQERMATLAASEYLKNPDVREIKKISSAGKGGLASMFGAQETTTESISPSEPILKPFAGVEVGDLVIAQ